MPKLIKTKKLGEIADIKSGSTPSRLQHERYFKDGIIPWVKTMDLNNGFIYKTDESITEIAIEETNCSVLPAGTVLVAMYGGFNQIGRTGLLKIDAAVNQAISAIRLDEKVALPEYILQYLNGRIDYWKRFAASSRKDPNITRNDVCDFPVLLPSLEEQKKIAEILATWDEAVTLTEKAIDAKKRLNKFLTSNLLFGKRRFIPVEKYQFREHYCFSFPNDWKLIKLAKVFEERRETSSDLEKYNLASLTIEDGLISKPKRYNRDFLLKDKESNQYRIVYPGDFVYNPMNLRWGAIDCSKLSEPVLVSAYYNVLIPNINIAPSSLLLALLTTSQMIHVYNNVGIGSLTEKKRVHLSDFLKLEVPLPSLSEATKIDLTLKTLDQEIFGLTRYKNLLFKQKQGLMQKLLTGELRVAVQEAA